MLASFFTGKHHSIFTFAPHLEPPKRRRERIEQERKEQIKAQSEAIAEAYQRSKKNIIITDA